VIEFDGSAPNLKPPFNSEFKFRNLKESKKELIIDGIWLKHTSEIQKEVGANSELFYPDEQTQVTIDNYALLSNLAYQEWQKGSSLSINKTIFFSLKEDSQFELNKDADDGADLRKSRGAGGWF
jgi:hypothetical protein